jgi:hypothetical protein
MPILGVIASSTRQGLVTTDFDSIASYVVPAGGVSVITFSSIPQTYTHLQIRAYGRFSGTVGAGFFKFNNTTGGYTYHSIWTDSANGFSSGSNGTANEGIWTGAAGTATGVPMPFVMDILDYTNTNKNKIAMTYTGWPNFSGTGGGGSSYIELASSMWVNTAAINRFDLLPQSYTFAENMTVSLYGIKE